MDARYPQETVGTTLLRVYEQGEVRRVFVVERVGYTEVGEFTRGPLTQELYHMPAHYHAVHVRGGGCDPYLKMFRTGDVYLADLMDKLDSQDVAYGYLNIMPDHHVAFRP